MPLQVGAARLRAGRHNVALVLVEDVPLDLSSSFDVVVVVVDVGGVLFKLVELGAGDFHFKFNLNWE